MRRMKVVNLFVESMSGGVCCYTAYICFRVIVQSRTSED